MIARLIPRNWQWCINWWYQLIFIYSWTLCLCNTNSLALKKSLDYIHEHLDEIYSCRNPGWKKAVGSSPGKFQSSLWWGNRSSPSAHNPKERYVSKQSRRVFTFEAPKRHRDILPLMVWLWFSKLASVALSKICFNCTPREYRLRGKRQGPCAAHSYNYRNTKKRLLVITKSLTADSNRKRVLSQTNVCMAGYTDHFLRHQIL